MSRWLLVSLIVGTGLACGAFAFAPALAQDRGSGPDSSRIRNDSDENPASKIDKAIEVYDSRAEQELEQTRKDIDRLRKQLSELNDLRLDMVIAVAQLRADLASQAAVSQESGGDSADKDQDKERRRLRAIELNREYRQIQDLLRNEVQQAQSSTDQFVAQLRALRAQQRQRQEQIEAERHPRKQAEDKDKDKDK